MRVLFFTRWFYPHIGGVEKHVYELSKRLIKKGLKVVVVTEKFEKSLPEHELFEGIEIYRIPVGHQEFFKKFKIWQWFLTHQKLIKEADIIHCHDVFYWFLPFRFFYPQKPVFTTFHGYEGNKLPSKKAIFMHKIAEKLSFGNICIGDFLKKWYGTKFDFTIYGGIDIKKISAKGRKHAEVKIVFLGRLEEEVGIMDYLKALKIIKEKNYKFQLIVLGDGIKRKKAEKFCHDYDLNVKFKGFVKNINEFLDQADYVFTSRYLAILESFAQKRIVFAVYNNLIKEDYLKMTPFAKWIVIEKLPENLAKKFEYLINHPKEKEELIRNAFKWVQNQTWDEVLKTYFDLWKKTDLIK